MNGEMLMYTIFLSSTFNDMQKEREVFHNVIMERLNRIISNYGSSVSLCDLRWGVDVMKTGEKEGTHKLIDVCFDSMRSSADCFVAVFGDRYGMVPGDDVSEKLMENGLEYHGQSVAEMEYEYYKLLKSGNADKALFLFRQPMPAEKMTDENRKIYIAENETERLKLEKLKDRIKKENPGRVFSYPVQWNEEKQDYTFDKFTELAGEKLELELIEFLGNLPIMTDEEKTLKESKEYFEQRVNLCANNKELVSGIDCEDKSGLQGTVFVRKEEEESSILADIYVQSDKKGILYDVLPVPFVAGINENACNGQHLLDCIIRALEVRFLNDEKTTWKNGSDMRQKAMKLIDFKPLGRYPIGTVEGRRYYLEMLLGYARTKRIKVSLFVQNFEKLKDLFARELQFLTATGANDDVINIYLEMTDKCYGKMVHIRSFNEHNVYELKGIKTEKNTESTVDKIVDFANKLNPTLAYYICQMLSITEYGISKNLLESVAVNIGIKWNNLDFEVFVRKFSAYIKCSHEGLYSFYDEALRKAVFEVTKPVKLFDMYSKYLNSLTVEDKEFYAECTAIAIRRRDADRVWEIINSSANSRVSNINILYALADALENDGKWFVENVTGNPTENSVNWFCREFYECMECDIRTPDIVEVIKLIAEAQWCPEFAKMLCHSQISEYCNKVGKHSLASGEFEKAFEIAEKIRGEHPVDTLKVISNYAYRCVLSKHENAEYYAKMVYSRAREISLTDESFLTVVYSYYSWLKAFENKESVLVVNDRYQQIFDMFEKLGSSVCFNFDKLHKRSFFDKIKLKYILACMEVCDSYADFLAKNHKKAEGLNIPCYMLNSADGEIMSVTSETDMETASVLYRSYAIDMANIKYNETHNIAMLELCGKLSYRQAQLMSERSKEEKAYALFESAVSAYKKAIKIYTNENDIVNANLLCADAYFAMGEVAEKIATEEYIKLCGQYYKKAYEIYNKTDFKYFSQGQFERFAECCIKLSVDDESGFYRKRAFEIYEYIEKESYSIYYNYYLYYKPKTDALLQKSVLELSSEDMTTMAITAMLLAKCFFFGADAKQANALYKENKSVIQSVAGYLGGMQNSDTVIGVYKYIRGFYFEYCYRMAEGRVEIAKAHMENYEKGLSKGLSIQQIKACMNVPLPENVIEYIRQAKG